MADITPDFTRHRERLWKNDAEPENTPVFFSLVRRVETTKGSHVVPPLNDDWCDLDKLRWLAAVVRVDSGLRIRVHPANYRVNGHKIPGHYSISMPGIGMTGGDFNETWRTINDIEAGASAMRRGMRA